jgi:RNA recognition motif-containing protein
MGELLQEVSMGTLFMVNVPHNCSDQELTEWVQSSGIEVKTIRVIRDTVSGASPSFAYVDIEEKMPVADAVQKLNGHSIRERVIMVSEARKGRTAA